jgi:hypothetical protein
VGKFVGDNAGLPFGLPLRPACAGRIFGYFPATFGSQIVAPGVAALASALFGNRAEIIADLLRQLPSHPANVLRALLGVLVTEVLLLPAESALDNHACPGQEYTSRFGRAHTLTILTLPWAPPPGGSPPLILPGLRPARPRGYPVGRQNGIV